MSLALQAITRVGDEQRGFVLRVVRRLGVPIDEQEDVAQEVLLVLHRRRGFVADDAMHSWLRVVAVQVARNQRRGARRRGARLVLVEDVDREGRAGGPLEDLLAHRELRMRLRRALGALDRSKLTVLHWSVVEGLTAEEIGRRLRVSPNTASSRLRAAKRVLREAMAAAGG